MLYLDTLKKKKKKKKKTAFLTSTVYWVHLTLFLMQQFMLSHDKQ